MNRSESINELATALAKAQAELRNPAFDSTNPHFRSKFASLAAVRDAVIPVFAKHGLSVTQWPATDGVYAGCVTVLAHSSGQYMEQAFQMPVDKQTAHIEKRLQLVLGIDKKLTLNSTNTKILVKRFGSDTNAWIGKTITLYYDESVSYAGRLTGGIRIRLPKARRGLPRTQDRHH